METDELDAARPLSEIVSGLASFIRQVGGRAEGATLTVEELDVRLPCELRVGSDGASVTRIEGAFPERTGTSFAPILQLLRLRVVRDHAGRQ